MTTTAAAAPDRNAHRGRWRRGQVARLTPHLAGSTLQLGTGGLGGAIITPANLQPRRRSSRTSPTAHPCRHISGTGTLSKAGAGTLILTGNNTYGGGTTITGGTLQLGNGGKSGSIAGNVTDNGTFAIDRSDTVTFGGVISGTGTFAQIGPGTTILTAINTYSGGTAINGGVLAVAADANLGAASGGLAFGGGTLQFLSGFTTNRAVTLSAGGGTFDTNGNNATLAGAISGPGGLSKIGAGTLTLSGAEHLHGARRSMPARCRPARSTPSRRPVRFLLRAAPSSTSQASTRRSARSPAPAPSPSARPRSPPATTTPARPFRA